MLGIKTSSNSIEFVARINSIDTCIVSYSKDAFLEFFHKNELDDVFRILKTQYSTLSGKEESHSFFEKVVIDAADYISMERIKNLEMENARLKAFLIYHIKTLRSVKYRIRSKSEEEAIQYIDTEIYNLSILRIEDLYKLLDSLKK